jgi:hypothetical protein
MLGRLRMSIAESIDAYLELSDRIFHKKRHRVTVKGKIQGRFDSEELARAVKDVIRQQGLREDALLKDTPEAGCKVLVSFKSVVPSKLTSIALYAQQAKKLVTRSALQATGRRAATATS